MDLPSSTRYVDGWLRFSEHVIANIKDDNRCGMSHEWRRVSHCPTNLPAFLLLYTYICGFTINSFSLIWCYALYRHTSIMFSDYYYALNVALRIKWTKLWIGVNQNMIQGHHHNGDQDARRPHMIRLICRQPILNKIYSFGNYGKGFISSCVTYCTFLLLDSEKWGLKWTYRRLRVTQMADCELIFILLCIG